MAPFRAPLGRAITLGVLVAMTIAGCDSGSGPTVLTTAQMREHLDRIPLPAGAVRTREDVTPRGGPDALGDITRQYRYSGAARPLCRTLLEGAARAGYTITDIGGDPVDPATCSTTPANRSMTTATGIAFVSAAHSEVAVGIGWTGDTAFQLTIRDNGG